MNDIGHVGYSLRVGEALQATRERVEEALRSQGFGILTDIDVQATLQDKLDVDIAGYRILGVCNPQLAHDALQHDPDVGIILPCTVTLREDSGGTQVSWLRPHAALALLETPSLAAFADEAERRLNAALAPLDEGAMKITMKPEDAGHAAGPPTKE